MPLRPEVDREIVAGQAHRRGGAGVEEVDAALGRTAGGEVLAVPQEFHIRVGTAAGQPGRQALQRRARVDERLWLKSTSRYWMKDRSAMFFSTAKF